MAFSSIPGRVALRTFLLGAGICISFWMQPCCYACYSFYPTASIFIAAPLSGKQFHHHFWLLVFLPWLSAWQIAPSQGTVFTCSLWIIILLASFAYSVPLCSSFSTNAIFLVSPWFCLPESHLPLGKLPAVSEIAQSAPCPNSEECFPHSQLKRYQAKKNTTNGNLSPKQLLV